MPIIIWANSYEIVVFWEFFCVWKLSYQYEPSNGSNDYSYSYTHSRIKSIMMINYIETNFTWQSINGEK